ncbi:MULTISPECIES: hypothetical protein [Gammaproteobacteria]|nr:hypothetical protein [Halopseudomonas gallaeciensis]
MTISIGAVMGGPESLPCESALKSAWGYFKGNESRPFLNVVFHFPGSLISPSYTGLRTGRFSSKEQGFMIQVAVPEKIAQSADKQAASEFFLSAIEEALKLSESRWKKHNISFPYGAARKHINLAREELLD